MGQLLHGKWTDDQPFAPGPHHNSLGTEEFPFDSNTKKGRYHLYISHSCPFAHRSLIARQLKKLDSTIALSIVNPINTDNGWSFSTDGFTKEDDIGDKVLGKNYLHEVYTAADSDYTGRVTVPLLIDTAPGDHKLGGDGKIRIVSNESAEIVDIFSKISSEGPDLNANADEQKKAIEVAQSFGGSTFKVGQAKNQKEYDEAVDAVYKNIESIENWLSSREFLASKGEPTTADVLFFPFLIRFDPAASLVYQLTRARLSDYPSIDKWLRRFYQLSGVKQTVVLDHIRKATFSPNSLKKFVAPKDEPIIPALPRLDWDKPVN